MVKKTFIREEEQNTIYLKKGFFYNDFIEKKNQPIGIIEKKLFHKYNYDFLTTHEESPIVKKIKSSEYSNLLPENIKKNKYSSLYTLLNHLLDLGMYDEYHKIIMLWAKSIDNNSYLLKDLEKNEYYDFIYSQTNHRIDLLEYLDNILINSAIESLINYQIDGAKWMIDRAWKVIITSNDFDYRIKDSVDRIILLKTILDNPYEVYVDLNKYLFLMVISNKKFNEEYIKKLNNINGSSYFNDLKTYWQAVHLFRKQKFGVAKDKVSSLLNNTNNKYLSELSWLLNARCIFWEAVEQKKQKNKTYVDKSIRILEKIKVNSIYNYKEDIEHYINTLKKDSTNSKNTLEYKLSRDELKKELNNYHKDIYLYELDY